MRYEAQNHALPELLVVSADPEVARVLQTRFGGADAVARLRVYAHPAQARQHLPREQRAVVVLDETACPDGREAAGTLVAAATELAERVPVLLLVSPKSATDLSALGDWMAEDRLDLVPRTGDFMTLVCSLVERRLAVTNVVLQSSGAEGSAGTETRTELSEALRHEVNNPLTGILGNAELLLARRDELSPAARERVEIIAGLAVRLCEAVHRISNQWAAAESAHSGKRHLASPGR